MPAYQKYPNKKEKPSRLARKGSRRTIFLFNKTLTKKAKKLLRTQRHQNQELSESE